MQREHIYDVINRCRDDFILDLGDDVFDHLREQNVLTSQEYKDIMSHRTREHRISAFLDMLPNKGNETYKPFINYVYEWHRWIPDKFKRTLSIQEKHEEEQKEVEDILLRGGVPPLPQRHISRKDAVAELRNKLHELRRGQYIMVYGMRGCGKSTLISEALRSHSLTFDAFKGAVQWIHGVCTDELSLFDDLYSRFFHKDGFGRNNIPYSCEKSMRHALKERLQEDRHREFLLVLDDVTSPDIVKKALDLGCKILITTHDKSLMKEVDNEVINFSVSDGFTEEETLALFKCTLGSSELPAQAKSLHSICKGFPMTISLISCQLGDNKDATLSNEHRWNYYVKKLKHSGLPAAIGSYDQRGMKQVKRLYSAIGMCIDSLPDALKLYYQDFALFLYDVNIRPEVLSILWDLDIKEVEDIMVQFEQKCLAVRLWNQPLNTYVYSIHDLLLGYLRGQLSEQQKKELHLRLINKYKQKFRDDFVNYPRDNYILLYLGHHLKEAGLYEEFPRLYLNLNYVETKIRANSPAELLLEYKKYEQYICNNEENKKKADDFEYFINWAGVRIYTSVSDIVQFGLQEGHHSAVYKEAVRIAETSDKHYFRFTRQQPKVLPAPSRYFSREEIVTAIFADFENNSLISNPSGDIKVTLYKKHIAEGNACMISNPSGDIKLINIKDKLTMATYKGHTDKVTYLLLLPALHGFLSASEDGTVRIWDLSGYMAGTACPEKPRTPSPSFKQDVWIDAWSETRSSGERPLMTLSGHRMAITHASSSSTSKFIATASRDKTVRMWTICERTIPICSHVFKVPNLPVSCCFTNDDSLIIVALDVGHILMYSVTTNTEFANILTDLPIKSLSIIPGEQIQCKVLVLGKDYFTVCSIVSANGGDKSVLSDCRCYKPIKCARNDHYICAALSADGMYVAVSSTNYSTVICNVDTGQIITKFYETNNGLTRSLDWARRNLLLLASYESKTLKLWNVEHNSTLRSAVKLRHSVFDAVWIKDNEYDSNDEKQLEIPENVNGVNNEVLVVAALNNRNNIQVFYDSNSLDKYTLIVPKAKAEVNFVVVSPKDGTVAYSLSDGSVYLSDDNGGSQLLFRISCKVFRKLRLFVRGRNELYITALVQENPDTYHLQSAIYSGLKNDIKCIVHGSGKDAIFDFFLHPEEDHMIAVLHDHRVQVYSSKTGMVVKSYSKREHSDVTFCDFSLRDHRICTISDECILFHEIVSFKRIITPLEVTPDHKPVVCKFSKTGRYLAIGFNDGYVWIVNVKTKKMRSQQQFIASCIVDIVWSSDDSKLLVIFNRDIVMTNSRLSNREAVLNLSVDKIVPSHSFDKFATVEPSGHLEILSYVT